LGGRAYSPPDPEQKEAETDNENDEGGSVHDLDVISGVPDASRPGSQQQRRFGRVKTKWAARSNRTCCESRFGIGTRGPVVGGTGSAPNGPQDDSGQPL